MSRTLSLLFLLFSLFSIGCRGEDDNSDKQGIFKDKAECEKKCIGDHDVNCAPIKGGGPQHACRCASTFYSVQETCDEECENGQYWSLFTHGSCNEYNSNVLTGACNKQCVFRFRTWTTVFIIILFAAAVIILIATLPSCILNCIACLRVRKQGRAIEDLHMAGDVGSGSKANAGGAGAQQMAAAMSPWQYPYYGYYGGGRT